jgi:hypothetical protein
VVPPTAPSAPPISAPVALHRGRLRNTPNGSSRACAEQSAAAHALARIIRICASRQAIANPGQMRRSK